MVKMHDSSVVRLAIFTTLMTVSAPWVSQIPAANAYPSFPQADPIAKGADVKIQGSSNIAPLNQSLKQGFEKQYAGAKVSVTNSNTKFALDAVVAGKADMAAIGRPLTDAEKAQGLVAIPIGREKIAIVVGKANPYTKDLTISQFAKVFRGEAKSWSELGGAKTAIRLIDRAETDTRKAFPNYPAFQGKAFATGSTALKLSDENPDSMSAKLGNNGISFLPASLVSAQSNVRALTMHGVKPTDARYPFSQPLYYVYKGATPNNAVKAFLGYAGTASGQTAVTSAGIAKAINFNNAAEAAAAEKDATAGAAAIAQAEKGTTPATPGANGKPADAGVKAGSLNAPAPKAGEPKAGEPGATSDAAKPADAVASNQIAADETGRGIPPWLWWLLLPLGLLGLLLWLLPKDEDEDQPLRPNPPATANPKASAGAAAGSRGLRNTRLNPLQGTQDAIGGAVDTVGDVASRTTGAVGNAAGRTVDTIGDAASKTASKTTDAVGNAAKSGGAAAAGLGAAIAGAGAAAFGRFKGDSSTSKPNTVNPNAGNAESEWEPGSSNPSDQFTIDTPDWNLDDGTGSGTSATSENSNNWLQNAKTRVGDVVDGTKDAAGNVVNRTGDTLGGITDKTGDALNAGGNAIGGTVAGAGAAAAGMGAAAWSVLSGRGDGGQPPAPTDFDLPVTNLPATSWEFEGGELPEASLDMSAPRMADYAIDGTAASGPANLAEGASNAAEGSSKWLGKWLGKAQDTAGDVAGNVTSSASNAADRLKDSIADTGAAAMAAGGAAVAGTGAAIGGVFSGTGRVVMVPYNSREALVRWEMDARAQDQMRAQGGNQLVLRLYDVTDMDINSQDLPQFEQFDVDATQQEQRILIPQRNRTYMTILGYLTRSGGFLEVSRSAVVQIPAA